jgi:hypothetical protein
MRVFVAYGYTDGERWVEELVLPILDALDITRIDGREIRGKPIDAAVRTRIGSADALIGFLLRRHQNPDRSWATSDYVRQEIEIALGQDKDVIQVVETGVPSPGGMLKGLQRLPYDASARDQFLVRLTAHFRDSVQGTVFVRLAPGALVTAIAQSGPPQSCDYEITHEGSVERTSRVSIVPQGGGLYVKLTGFRPGRHANLRIDAGGRRWSCEGVTYTQPFVTMKLT